MIVQPLIFVALWQTLAMTGSANAGVTVNGEPVPYETWHAAVMPGEQVSIDRPSSMVLEFDGEAVTGRSISAPTAPGVHRIEISDSNGDRAYEISLFVLEPSSKVDANGYLNGFRMGSYPQDTPVGFIRLDAEDVDAPVSPSFTIGQFLCHQQPSHWPKYLLVTKSNLKRLETLLAALREDGLTDADSFFVMSGFRSPFYNTAIGSATLSRHMYGDAADIYLDVAPRDGVMDDINEDGVITKDDADFLYDYAASLFAKDDTVSAGGLGSYKANAVHGPFVHVDGRGRAARWGR